MKKHFLIIISVIMCLFFINSNVYAEECKCRYTGSHKTGLFGWFEKNDSVIFSYNTETNEINYNIQETDSVYVLDPYVSEKYTIPYIIESLNNGCPKKLTFGGLAFEDLFGYAIFFEESHLYSLEKSSFGPDKFYVLPSKFLTDNNLLGNIPEKLVLYMEYNEEGSTCSAVDTSLECEYFSKLYDGDEDNAGLINLKCKSKDSNCTVEENLEYNDSLNKLKYFCHSVLENASVGYSNCITPCLELPERITKLEEVSENSCGFSDRLMNWIDNILKWIKYILPVIVIVFGIVDFIKAFTSDKDDEMKKSQKRFIIRLISAALAFLIPFIIEFILEKMGFVSESCGLW